MTTEELKAHRRAICEALIEGKQCQLKSEGVWVDAHASSVACELFAETKFHDVRIKPEPRKVWIGWHASGQCLVSGDDRKHYYEQQWGLVKWQLVEEPV